TPREPPQYERLVPVPREGERHLLILDRRFPLADEPLQVFQPVLSRAPLSTHGRQPSAAGANLRDAVHRRRRKGFWRDGLAQRSFLDGQLRRREANGANEDFDLGLWVLLEVLRERLLDRGAAGDGGAARVGEFAVLGPLGCDGAGVAFVERGRELAGRDANR